MAQRYGGKYSPGSASHPRTPEGLRRSRAGARVNFLFVAPVAMLLVAFQLEPTGMFLKTPITPAVSPRSQPFRARFSEVS